VAEIRASFPTLPADTSWVLTSRPALAAVVPGGEVPATEAFIKAGPDAGPTIAKALQDRLPAQGRLASRFDATAGLRNAPGYVAVVFGLAAASFVAAAYGALAIFVALLLAGAEQSRESAHLRVLGLSRRENLGLSAVEHGPASLLVIIAGVALGAGLFAFLQSGLGLGQLVGGDIDVGLPIEALSVAAIFGAIGAIVAIAVGLETLAESIINPTAALRRGMD
jgi:ABC-type antimicrobial peptide transport system permease subunit